jgi:rare lipoprotein A
MRPALERGLAFARALFDGLARVLARALPVARVLASFTAKALERAWPVARKLLSLLGKALLRALRAARWLMRRLAELPPERIMQSCAIGALLVTLWSCCPAQPSRREATNASSSGGERGENERRGAVLRGDASYYAAFFRGRKTANGERYDPRKFTAANRTLPLGTRLRVTRLDTGKSVVVRVNDRGPFGKRSRILDLSRAAAEELDMIKVGHTEVEAVVLE